MNRLGRPSFGPRAMIPARVPQELHDRLAAIADELGVPKTEVAARLIAASIDRYEVADLPKMYHSNKPKRNEELPLTG